MFLLKNSFPLFILGSGSAYILQYKLVKLPALSIYCACTSDFTLSLFMHSFLVNLWPVNHTWLPSFKLSCSFVYPWVLAQVLFNHPHLLRVLQQNPTDKVFSYFIPNASKWRLSSGHSSTKSLLCKCGFTLRGIVICTLQCIETIQESFSDSLFRLSLHMSAL